jgi:hypothetical protein
MDEMPKKKSSGRKKPAPKKRAPKAPAPALAPAEPPVESVKAKRKAWAREAALSAEHEIARLGGGAVVRKVCMGDRLMIARLAKLTYPLKGPEHNKYRRLIYGRKFKEFLKEPQTMPEIPPAERLPFPPTAKTEPEVKREEDMF